MQPEVVFVKPPTEYPSYRDFWRLVELCGFPTASAGEAHLDSQGILIFPCMEGQFLSRLMAHPKPRPARVVWWYLERPDVNYRPDRALEAFVFGNDEALAWVDEIWVSDGYLHQADRRTRLIPFGSHPALAEQARSNSPDVDVVHIGQRTPRRDKVLSELERRGLRVIDAGWGPGRADAIARARLAVNIERVEGLHFLAPLRLAVFGAYGVPILTETVATLKPFESMDVFEAKYESLADVAEALVQPRLRDVLEAAGASVRRAYAERYPFCETVLRAARCRKEA